MANNLQGIELRETRPTYPPGARFVWNLEFSGEQIVHATKTEPERQELIQRWKKVGSANGMYANELTGLCRPEENFSNYFATHRISSQCGVPLTLPDQRCSWLYLGNVSAMAQAGIRYFSAAPNYLRPHWNLYG